MDSEKQTGREKRFAVLIDADNVSDKYIAGILSEVAKYGLATYRRIYGDWTSPSLGSWKRELLDNSILPMQQYGYTSGKNSTDSALIIDAMDILYSGQVDGFFIVSSDSDFTRLAARLRESGMVVVGMGERKTPKPFISACNKFLYLEILPKSGGGSAPKPKLPAPQQPPKRQQQQKRCQQAPAVPLPMPVQEDVGAKEDMTSLETIQEAIRVIAQEYSDEDDWMFTGTIGNLLVKRFPDFDVRNYGFRKLTALLESLNLLDFKSERTGTGDARLVYVKLKEQEP